MDRSKPSGKDVSVNTVEHASSELTPPSLSPSSPYRSTPTEEVMARPEWRAAEKSLVRKLDMTLMPVIWTLYLFNYLDRNNLAYMAAQLPSNMLLTRTRPSIYIPSCVLAWSCVSAATAAAKSFSSLVALRVVLGLVEAPFFPGIFYVLSCWYTQKEIAFRTAILYSGMLVATAFSGLIAAGVFAHLDGAHGLAGWQWLFIIAPLEGAGSFASAFTAFVFLPDYIGSKTGVCSWLMTDEELLVAAQRMDADRVSAPQEKGTVWNGLSLAVKDVRTWIFVCMQAFYLSSHGLNSFFPTIVQGFRLGSNTITLVLTAPPYLVAAAVALCVAVSSDRRADRGMHIIGPVCAAVVGFIITAATTNRPARYFASFLYLPGAFASTGLIFSWAGSVMGQTPEKRAAATAIVCLLAQFGNIWSPFFFRPEDSPRYLLAFFLMIAFSGLCIGTVFLMRRMLGRANQRMLDEAAVTGRRVRLYIL
ncbi:putative major facilitator superfamily transporter [Colletotrichum sublineola]|uniref:Putative major facilitator superfamily transporter n=1 Tax=Colletotrichum sublineola TaxID=1173701 RepID=A0A066XED1_COLSU|nr:putative major facilitator superfamily transporter [Colletotrichum sublineola]